MHAHRKKKPFTHHACKWFHAFTQNIFELHAEKKGLHAITHAHGGLVLNKHFDFPEFPNDISSFPESRTKSLSRIPKRKKGQFPNSRTSWGGLMTCLLDKWNYRFSAKHVPINLACRPLSFSPQKRGKSNTFSVKVVKKPENREIGKQNEILNILVRAHSLIMNNNTRSILFSIFGGYFVWYLQNIINEWNVSCQRTYIHWQCNDFLI